VQASAALATAAAAPAAQAQSITVTPLAAQAPAAIPVGHPLALALLALAMGACLAWGLRKGHISLHSLLAWATGGAMVVTASLAVWGDRVQAQIQELQEAFIQAAGETRRIPVQATALAADGAPLGFLPVVYQNQAPARLKITNLTEPAWNTCFPLGVPAILPTTTPRPGNACAVGLVLEAAGSCWVDVAQLCADAAATVRGSHASVLTPDSVLVDTAGQRAGNVLSNDSDADGALVVTSFSYEGQTVAAGSSRNVAGRGTFALQADGSFTFQADADYSGSYPLVIAYSVQTGASSTLNISVNRVPVAGNDTATTDAGSSVTIAVRGNDSDADGDSLTVTGVSQGANGWVVVDALTGNPIYTPHAGFSGVDHFTYTVGDGRGGSVAASVTVTVKAIVPGNQPPVTVADAISVSQGGTANTLVGGATSVLANDTDPDGNALVAVLVTGPSQGTLSLNANGTFSYTHNGSPTVTDRFTYRANDGQVNGNVATVTIAVVVPVNRAPVANDDRFAVKINTAQVIAFSQLLDNDSDPDGDSLAVASVQSIVHGTLSDMSGNLVFTPDADFEGLAGFEYTISDGHGGSSTARVHITVGSATAPSLVLLKSLLAIAHGTGGTSAGFPVTTRLLDTDGSESLSVKISNVPTGLTFSAGTNLGGGVWQFTAAELPLLMLNLPGSYSTNASNLTVQVAATEVNGGATASTSSVVTLKAAYTTVDITTTESGSYTGSSANEYIQGGSGNNTINAASGNNVVLGGAGNDTLSSGPGSDMLSGGSGNDTLNAGAGTDWLWGGAGNDTLIGGDAGENFVDVFVWRLGDQGAAGAPAVDRIQNFATAAAGLNTAGGDVLDLRDLLQGESLGPGNGAGNLADYLHFELAGGNTVVHISHTGGFAADAHAVGTSYTAAQETQQILLEGVNLPLLYAGATTDQQIITQLLNNQKLIVD
jgi:hypothetical protein